MFRAEGMQGMRKDYIRCRLLPRCHLQQALSHLLLSSPQPLGLDQLRQPTRAIGVKLALPHLPEKYLQEHPDYTPKGWPDAVLPPLAQEALKTDVDRPLPNGLRVRDIVVFWKEDCILTDGLVLQRGEAGRILGWATDNLKKRCSFLSLDGTVTVDPEEMTKQTVPGGFKVGDIAISLIYHKSMHAEICRGHVGRVVAQASVDLDVRLKVDFPNLRGLDIHFEQVCPETLPGGCSLDDDIVSLIDYATNPNLGSDMRVADGEQGTVVGQAIAERRIRLKGDFQRVKGLDVLPSQIAPLQLPGNFRVGESVVSLIDYESAGMVLRRGDVGRVAGKALGEPIEGVRVDFPDIANADSGCTSRRLTEAWSFGVSSHWHEDSLC